jgi:ATPase family associated with various cellular activities (AAA)
MRSCRLLDYDKRFDRFTGEIIRLLRRFWEWLAARRIGFTLDGTKLHGWHSEHVADVDSIQLWDTAQVVEFLLGFRYRLRLHIAHTTLRLARFDVRTPAKAQAPWSEKTRSLQMRHGHVRATDAKSTIVGQFEPVTTLGPHFETYRRIGEDFIEGWLSGERVGFSMLLFGPPGTGKTSVAKNIADALGFRLITITVSDFLAEGGGAVEARAKMIFEVLEAQADCVVLFDEIDELLLDRSSARHGAQETVFKFMTPGMLTKLNNLRDQQRVIFILATNYAYRIDPAIRRTGRIDENYLLLPPDQPARKEMLRKFLKKHFGEEGPLSPKNIGDKPITELSLTARFLGYKDIEAAVARVSRRSTPNVSALNDILRDSSRTTSLTFYRSAFSEVHDTEPVKNEFLPLVEMVVREDPSYDLPADFTTGNNNKLVFQSKDDIRAAAKRCVEGARY